MIIQAPVAPSLEITDQATEISWITTRIRNDEQDNRSDKKRMHVRTRR